MSKIVINSDLYMSNYSSILAVKQFIDENRIDIKNKGQGKNNRVVEIHDHEEILVTQEIDSHDPCDVTFTTKRVD